MPKRQGKTPPPDWHAADVIAALHKRGMSLRQLALTRGYAPRSLHKALSHPWKRAEEIIAAALGVEPRTIWPSRFLADGTRVDRRRRMS